MKIETATKANEIIKKIKDSEILVSTLSDRGRVLCIALELGYNHDSFSVNKDATRLLTETLDRHLQQIIQEQKDKIKELEKQLEEL